MRKYMEVFRISIKEFLAYRVDIIISSVMSLFRILIAFYLWRTIFADKTHIGAYTFPMMMTYYILTSLFLKLNQSVDVLWQFSGEIKKGYFTKYIILPLNPVHFFMTKSLSRTIAVLTVNSFAFIGWIIIFRQYFISPRADVLAYVVFFALSGMLIMMQISYMVSMFAFKFVEIVGFYYMLQSIMDFLSGLMIPLFLLPHAFVNVIKFLPFYYTLYFPASLYLGQNIQQIPLAFVVVTVWNLLFYVTNQMMFKYSIRYYEGVGA